MNDFFKTKLMFLISFFTVLITLKGFQFDKTISLSIKLNKYSISLADINTIVIVLLLLSIFSYGYLFIKEGKFKFARKTGDFFYTVSLYFVFIVLFTFLITELTIPAFDKISIKIFVYIIPLCLLILFIVSVVTSSNYINKISHLIFDKNIDVLNMEFKTNHKYVYNLAKRITDILFAIFCLMVLLPLIILIAVIIKIDSRGPILYTQDRIGINSKTFKMYKFRSMIENTIGTETSRGKENNDARITKVGWILRKTSLDEIPIIINIIKGDVSLIGPRPLLPYFYDVGLSDLKIQKLILSVKPGVIGLAAVNAKHYNYSYAEFINFEVYYIKNKSTLLDISIFLNSLKIIAFSR